MKRIFLHNWGLKVISILLAFLIWWLIRAERESLQENPVPSELKLMKKHEITIQK
jgi:YbbR domain-containing protein